MIYRGEEFQSGDLVSRFGKSAMFHEQREPVFIAIGIGVSVAATATVAAGVLAGIGAAAGMATISAALYGIASKPDAPKYSQLQFGSSNFSGRTGGTGGTDKSNAILDDTKDLTKQLAAEKKNLISLQARLDRITNKK